jgi:hypothetical protein
MGAEQAQNWLALITGAVGLGVQSWSTIHSMMLDAGVDPDDPVIEELRGKYQILRADVSRAAGN